MTLEPLGNYQGGQQHVCPACGYCPCCGRKNEVPVPFYPQGTNYPQPYDPVYTTGGCNTFEGPQVQSYN